MTETSARLVSAENGLFLFYFGRQWIQATQSYNVRLYVVKLSEDGRSVGDSGVDSRESRRGEPGPIHVVTVGYSAYVAIPPTDAGPGAPSGEPLGPVRDHLGRGQGTAIGFRGKVSASAPTARRSLGATSTGTFYKVSCPSETTSTFRSTTTP